VNPRAQALEALSALRIDAPTSFSWLGEPGPALPPEVANAMDAATAATYLQYTLQGHLYANFYTRGAAVPSRHDDYAPGAGLTPFVQALSAANAGSGSSDSGWIVVREEENGRIVVARDGLSLWAWPAEIDGPRREPGAEVHIRMPKELLRLSPGFYFALGEAPFADGEPVVRVYWHLRSEGAAELMARLTGPLNADGLPFRAKVLNDARAYSRCDAGVLYVHQTDFPSVAEHVTRAYGALRPQLRAATPALTKPVAEGLAVAEEPGTGESFGMDRCRLLAVGAIQAWEAEATQPEEQLAFVEASFAEAGLSIDAPHLNAGSIDTYELPT